LIIVAARPSMGKTAFATTVGQHAAFQLSKVVALFSLEMSKQSLIGRILCSEAHVDAHRYRSGFTNSEEVQRLAAAQQLMGGKKFFIDDTAGISPALVKSKARRLAAQQEDKKIDLIIVDYLQLMSGSHRRYESRQQEVTHICKELKAVAKEMKCPLIALSQLSRAPELRSNKKPQLSDLRESGSIEQDADVVAFIFREEVYNQTDDNAGVAEIIIGKQRNGPTTTVKLAFLKEFTRFENMWASNDSQGF
jgi:replicative DNA helicase